MVTALSPLCVNIWDDYDDEGHRTFAYVEDDATPAQEQAALETLAKACREWALAGGHALLVQVEFRRGPHISRWEVRFEGLSHRLREALVSHLKKSPPVAGAYALRVYSES